MIDVSSIHAYKIRRCLPKDSRSSPSCPSETITAPDKSRRPDLKVVATKQYPALRDLANTCIKSTALLIGGGLSGARWRELYNELHPDLVVGVNGTIGAIGEYLDVWLCIENLAYMMPWFQCTTPKIRCVSAIIFQRAPQPETIIPVHRNIKKCSNTDDMPGIRLVSLNSNYDDFKLSVDNLTHLDIRRPSFVPVSHAWLKERHANNITDRNYGLMGGVIEAALGQPDHHLKDRDVGTVMFQAMHLCGIMGCAQVHTVGLDLCFKGATHWYEDRNYDSTANIADLTGTANWARDMYTTQYGLDTTWWWIECAALWELMDPIWRMQGLAWTDHSDGLLQRRCEASAPRRAKWYRQ